VRVERKILSLFEGRRNRKRRKKKREKEKTRERKREKPQDWELFQVQGVQP
jgi:hypothetical protein